MMLTDKAPLIDWHGLAPEVVLASVAIIILVADLFFKKRSAWRSSNIAAFGFLIALVPVITLAFDGSERRLFGDTYVVDKYSLIFKAFFIVGGYLTVLIGGDYIREGDYFQSEFWFLLAISVLGMSSLASSRDLITMFVALETLSIPTFVLAGWRRRDTRSNEASIKYYLMGVMSSAVMIYGMSFILGFSGTTHFSGISQYFQGPDLPALSYVALIFTLVGFAFKVSAVPFHQWAPDVYEGAPLPVTTFLSVLSKAAGFVGLTLLLQHAFFPAYEYWMPIIYLMVVASLIVGNFSALKQRGLVRLLAYSSIAQGGFVLLPLAFLGGTSSDFPMASAIEATVIYLIIYLFANMGAFACAIGVVRTLRTDKLSSLAGFGKSNPFLGITLTIFLFSLAGIPPLAGWFAKFVMFRSALEVLSPSSVVMAAIAGVMSVVALTYYAGVVKMMWLEESVEEQEEVLEDAKGSIFTRSKAVMAVPPALKVSIVVCVIGTIGLGIFPSLISNLF